MSTKHSKAAEKFLQDSKMAAWHNETLWMVRAKRDKMSKEVPEWEELRNKACELKLYSNSHLEELLLEFEKNATANGAIVHWAKDADEYCAIVYEILNEHNVHHFIKSKSMLAEECGLNPFLMERGIDVGPVNKALFRTKSPVRLAMEARMVADMELYDNGRVVVMSIPLALCRELGAAESDVEELSSLAALVQGTDCGITLRELKPGRVKLSLRTGPRVDASAVCRVLGGGGHKGAAGATVDGTLDEAKAAILAAYTEVMG